MNGADFNPGAEVKSVQVAVVLAALRTGPQSTAALRAILGLSSSPAARVLDLRRAGHDIVTTKQGRRALPPDIRSN